METSHQFCTFYLHNFLFGIDVLRVQEVLRYQEMTRVPLAPAEVQGLINLRGQIVTAIDMRRRLELPGRNKSGPPPMNIIVRTEESVPVSLLVDEIGEVLKAGEDSFEPPPETLRGVAREIIRGAYKLPKRLMLVLDTEAAVAVAGRRERSNLAGVREENTCGSLEERNRRTDGKGLRNSAFAV